MLEFISFLSDISRFSTNVKIEIISNLSSDKVVNFIKEFSQYQSDENVMFYNKKLILVEIRKHPKFL